jgi:hypothetical protein
MSAKRVGIIALALALGAPACSGMRSFRVQGGAETKPSPAARSTSDQQRSPAEVAFGLLRDDDFVVRVVAGHRACTGTLIDEDQVLTAHHCVAESGKGGEFLNKNVSARDINVELGGDYLPWGDVGVRAVVAPPCGWGAGDGDIAVLVLERKLIGVKTVKPRLDKAPEMGEHLDPVGFGRCSLSSDAISRHQRLGGRVDKMLDMRFRLSAAICPGDSGGPVIGRGEVVGVISAAVMDGNESTRDRAEFTRLDRWRTVFSTAKLIAEGASSSELPPVDGCPGTNPAP